MADKPEGTADTPVADPLATVDREFRAMMARMTGGISVQDYGAAFADSLGAKQSQRRRRLQSIAFDIR